MGASGARLNEHYPNLYPRWHLYYSCRRQNGVLFRDRDTIALFRCADGLFLYFSVTSNLLPPSRAAPPRARLTRYHRHPCVSHYRSYWNNPTSDLPRASLFEAESYFLLGPVGTLLLRRFYLSTLGCVGSPKSLSRCTMALGVCVFVEEQTRTDRPGSVERARCGPGPAGAKAKGLRETSGAGRARAAIVRES